MTSQHVCREWIVLFDASYVNKYLHRLEENSRIFCRSCNQQFECGDIIHNQYRPSSPATKRHLSCAILHHVITLKEARTLAKDLPVDWGAIKLQIEETKERRRNRGVFW